jgi:hypothetical protein
MIKISDNLINLKLNKKINNNNKIKDFNNYLEIFMTILLVKMYF